jgi:2,3-dihydroxybenzoate decarboxylase
MRKIALDEHFITPDFVKYTQTDFAAMKKQTVNEFLTNLYDFDYYRLETMDKAGIEISVLSLANPGVQREPNTALAVALAQKANDFLAEKISKNPKRFRGFAHLALQSPQAAAAELERCVKDYHFVGALINGQTSNRYLDEAEYDPFWMKVQELEVPIYLHPGSPYTVPQNYKDHLELDGPLWGWTTETGTHALRLLFSGLFDRFPSIKIILGHMGETLPYLLWRFDSRWEILEDSKKLKKAPSAYIKENIYITTSGMCANGPLLCAVSELGEENVMFSVDYPYESTEIAAQFIEKAPLSKKVLEKICFQNAKRLLKLKSD